MSFDRESSVRGTDAMISVLSPSSKVAGLASPRSIGVLPCASSLSHFLSWLQFWGGFFQHFRCFRFPLTELTRKQFSSVETDNFRAPSKKGLRVAFSPFSPSPRRCEMDLGNLAIRTEARKGDLERQKSPF